MLYYLATVNMLSFAVFGCAVALLSPKATLAAGSLADINHVVLFMQENRAFDHVCVGPQIIETDKLRLRL